MFSLHPSLMALLKQHVTTQLPGRKYLSAFLLHPSLMALLNNMWLPNSQAESTCPRFCYTHHWWHYWTTCDYLTLRQKVLVRIFITPNIDGIILNLLKQYVTFQLPDRKHLSMFLLHPSLMVLPEQHMTILLLSMFFIYFTLIINDISQSKWSGIFLFAVDFVLFVDRIYAID